MTKAALRLAESSLTALVQLSGRSSHLSTADDGRLVGAAQQDVGLGVHLRVVNKNPLVVELLLVVDADGGIFAHAGNANHRPAAEGLVGAPGGRAKGCTSRLAPAGAALLAAARSQAEGVGERVAPLLSVPLRRVPGATAGSVSGNPGLLLRRRRSALVEARRGGVDDVARAGR